MTVSLATAKEIRLAAAIVALLSEVGGMFVLKDKQRMARNTFLGGQHVSTLLTALFGKS